MFKTLQARLQQYVNHELPDVQGGFKRQRQRPAPHRHVHGDLTSLTPEESLPELPVVPLRKPHSGTASLKNVTNLAHKWA